MNHNLEDTVLSLGKVIESKITWLEPAELICWERMDIIARIIYAKNLLNSVNDSKSQRIYLECIRVINDFSEVDSQVSKRSESKFLLGFDKLFHSMKSLGFSEDLSVIALNQEGKPLNGAHRIAAAYVLGLKVPTIRIDTEKSHVYSPFVLMNRGMAVEDIRVLIWNYHKLINVLTPILVFGANNRNQQIFEANLKDYMYIFKETSKFKIDQLVNLNVEMYQHETWFRNSDNPYRLILGRVKQFQSSTVFLTVYYIQSEDFDGIQLLKTQIRTKIGQGNLPIHTVQNFEENNYLLRCLLEPVSRSLLNRRRRKCYQDGRHEKLFQLINELKLSDRVLAEKCVISGSAILEEYGLRKADDLDIILFDDEQCESQSSSPEFDNHFREVSQILKIGQNRIRFRDFEEERFRTFAHLGFLWLDLTEWEKILRERKDKKSQFDIFLIRTLSVRRFGILNYFVVLQINLVIYIKKLLKNILPKTLLSFLSSRKLLIRKLRH
jgi:hypothetical protein